MNTLKKAITVLTLSTLGFTFTANAGPIVTAWDWVVDTAFTAFAPGTVNGSLDNIYWDSQTLALNDAPTTLSWGNNNSSLVIGGVNGHTEGDNLANGMLTQTTSLTHNNFVINGGALTSAQLSTRLLLDPNPKAGLFDVMPPALVFDISFLETFNDNSCEVASITPCRDIFVINAGDFNQQFMLDGNVYNVELLVDGLDVLTNEACDAVGVADGCIGFTTAENASSPFAVNMRITSVPEPSSILLLSLALFGIIASTRSKRI